MFNLGDTVQKQVQGKDDPLCSNRHRKADHHQNQRAGRFSPRVGGSPGATYILESTSNLGSPEGWLPVATNVFDLTGIGQLSDRRATNFPRQFYRLKSSQ
jgi:hypothetical protein